MRHYRKLAYYKLAYYIGAMLPLSPAKNLYLLMQDVARLLRREIDQRAQSIGLTSAQWRILASVSRAEFLSQEPLSQAALADQMEMEPITLSRHIDRMEAAGLIERRANPVDRRAYRLFVTETAKPLVQSFRAIGTECISEALKGVSEAEIAQVTNVLERMRNNIVARPEPAPAATPVRKGRVA